MARLCVLASSFPRYRGDPSGIFLFELLKRQIENGHQVDVVTPHDLASSILDVWSGVRVHRFSYMYPTHLQKLAYGSSIPENVKRTKIAVLEVATYMFLGTIKALQTIKQHKANLIIPFWTIPQGLMGVILKRITGRPLIIGAFPVELCLAMSRYRFLIPLLRRALNTADAVIVNSCFTKKLVMCFGVPSQRTLVVYPGVDLNRYGGDQQEIKVKYGYTDSLIVLAVGRLIERKGIKYLLEAMPKVLSAMGNTILLVVGDGPERSMLEEESRRLSLDGKVLFLGRVQDEVLLDLYMACDVFVLPAIVDSDGNTEGLGVVLLEAMAASKPVISSRVGGIPEVVVNDETGILVQPKDSCALAEAIIELLRDDRLLVRMGQMGRKRVEKLFDWDIIARNFSEFIDSFLTRYNMKKLSCNQVTE